MFVYTHVHAQSARMIGSSHHTCLHNMIHRYRLEFGTTKSAAPQLASAERGLQRRATTAVAELRVADARDSARAARREAAEAGAMASKARQLALLRATLPNAMLTYVPQRKRRRSSKKSCGSDTKPPQRSELRCINKRQQQ